MLIGASNSFGEGVVLASWAVGEILWNWAPTRADVAAGSAVCLLAGATPASSAVGFEAAVCLDNNDESTLPLPILCNSSYWENKFKLQIQMSTQNIYP